MKTLKELRKERSDKAARGKAATAEYNTVSAKTDKSADDEAKIVALDTEIEGLEAACDELDAQITAEEKKARRDAVFQTAAIPVPGRSAGRVYGEPGPGMGGYHNMAEFGQSVVRAVTGGGIDPRLTALNAPVVGAAPASYEQNQGSAGEGFLVPPDFRTNIWELAFDPVDLLGMVTPIPTNSNFITMPKDETTPWGATGVQAYWRAEASQMTASKISVGQVTLQLHELYAFVIATNEILDDAPRLNDLLTTQAARAIRWVASDAIMWGDGNGKPLGFMNAACLVTQTKEGGQVATTIVSQNITKMSSRLLRFGGGKPMWIANSDVEPQLAGITLGNIPYFLPNNQPGSAPVYEGSIRGKPALFSEHSQTLGTLGDIVLFNPDGYALATKAGGGVDFAASIHLFFDYGMQAFRWTFRLGGQPYLSAAVSPAHGSNTKSHFVTLQAR